MNPRVSIVIPTYRRPGPTARAVRSALGQNSVEVEVIVVDDGSDDGTAEAAEAIEDDRVRVVRLGRNQGVCAARNRGIAEARAPYIALLDSDDELLPDSVALRLECLEAAPDSPLVYSRIYYAISAKTRLVAPEQSLDPNENFLDALIVRQGLATSAMLARTEALRKCPFDPRLAGVDDWDVSLNLSRLGPVRFVEEPLSIVHAEDETEGQRVTFSIDARTEEIFLDLHREAFDRSPKAEAVVLYKLAMAAVRSHREELAADYLKRVVELDPDHPKASVIARGLKFGLGPVLPTLLKWRWKLLLATGRAR